MKQKHTKDTQINTNKSMLSIGGEGVSHIWDHTVSPMGDDTVTVNRWAKKMRSPVRFFPVIIGYRWLWQMIGSLWFSIRV